MEKLRIENLGNNSTHGEFTKTFKPLLYNIWDAKTDDETSHFGSFPAVFMENLLYYHTKPLDIIYDPFAGEIIRQSADSKNNIIDLREGENMKKQEAQDELTKLLLAPMQRQIDEINARNAQNEKAEKEIERKRNLGECVASFCVLCDCEGCLANGRAYDAVDDKSKETTAMSALLAAGFIQKEAEHHISIFDELGIFTEVELFCADNKRST